MNGKNMEMENLYGERRSGSFFRSPMAAYGAAFFGPVLILVTVLICNGVFPFGEECFLRTDMYHQYAPFFSELQEKLRTGGSLLYSWDVGLGVNFTALYAYYLASPLNWLVIFCPKAYIIEFMTVMVVGKLGLAGLAMTWYLRNRFRTRDFGTAFFGIFYALSGYMAAYYWNLMWLDCIILFPLIVRGLELLVEEKRGALYAGTLGLSILSNYYISIMTCLFLVIYFLALNILHKPESFPAFLGRCLRFAACSLLAGGLAAVLLFPEIAALTYTASYKFSFPQTVTQYFTIIDMLARHLVGVETEQGLNHWPNIYCGTAVLLLFALYLSTARIRLKEKAVYVGLLIFFLLSFSINVLNFIWHGLHYPNSLPARQSYIYIFLALFVGYRAYMHLGSLGARRLGRAFLLTAGFVLLCQKLITAEHFQFWVFYVSLLLLALYGLLIYLWRRKVLRRGTVTLLALCLVLGEAAANTALTSITTTSRKAYTEDNENVRALVDSLFPTSEFFRVEKITRKTKNDGAWMNFPSVSLFSSMANADCTAFFKALGCEASTNAYSITGSTPFVNMLFSVKYGIYNSPQENGEEKRFIESMGESYLYENNYSLPLGFVMPEGMKDRWVQDMDNPALVQDALCDVLGTRALLVPNEELPSESGEDLAVTLGQSGEYYAFVTNPQVKKVSVTWKGQTQTFDNVDRGYFIELGHCNAGEFVSMKSETSGQAMEAQIYRFDYEALREVWYRLSQYPLELSVWEDSRIMGTVQVNPERMGYQGDSAPLFLSIPYDSGWTAYVDGRQVPTEKAFDTFLCLELPEGTHTVELRFMPTGLREGAALSGICLVLLVLLALLDRRRKKFGIREEALSGEYPEDSKEYFHEGEDRVARYFLKDDPEPEPREAAMEPEKTAPGEDVPPEEALAPEEDPEPGEDELLEVFGQAGGKQDILQMLSDLEDRELPEKAPEQEPEGPGPDPEPETDELERLIRALETKGGQEEKQV